MLTKDEIKSSLASYKYDSELYKAKSEEATKFKEVNLKNIERLKLISNSENDPIVEDAIKSYSNKITELEKDLASLSNKLKNTENLVKVLNQPYRNAVHFRYIVGLSAEQVASKMNYSPQRIYQFLTKGFKIIYEKEGA